MDHITTISVEKWQNWAIITINGRFVVKYMAEIRKTIESNLAIETPFIAFNLTNTNYLDSSAMTLMLNFHKKLSDKNGRIVIFGANQHITEVLTIVGFDSFVPMFADRDTFEKNAPTI